MDGFMSSSWNSTINDSFVEGSQRTVLANEEIANTGEGTDPLYEDEGDESNVVSSDEEHANIYKIDDKSDIKKVDFIGLTEDVMKMYHFRTHLVAFNFYNTYAEKKGFVARRFVADTGRWHVKAVSDEHIHEMLAQRYTRIFPAHRKMDDFEVMQMNSMKDVGIGVTQIYGLAANQSGGFERLGFRKRDMYNEVEKQRRMQVSDVRVAFAYLKELGSSDSDMFWRRTIDEEGVACLVTMMSSNQWVTELYKKRKMWAAAHIRGNFFVGFRTTSRCKGMHSQVGRQKEVEADFESIIGEPVLQTSFLDIERCAANYYTKKWYVSLVPPTVELKCSCLRMESMGISCEHIVALLHYLEISSLLRSNVMGLLLDCYEVCRLAGRSRPNLDLYKEVVRDLLLKLREAEVPATTKTANENDGHDDDSGVRDPTRVRTKGCGSRQPVGGMRTNRRTTCCSICQGPGHNRRHVLSEGLKGMMGHQLLLKTVKVLNMLSFI
ncbi:Zinc finger, SWIM-type [Sesbania bispinosa]|nr:Zinc finger, SWIM-type [Sesbania bispinosa]